MLCSAPVFLPISPPTSFLDILFFLSLLSLLLPFLSYFPPIFFLYSLFLSISPPPLILFFLSLFCLPPSISYSPPPISFLYSLLPSILPPLDILFFLFLLFLLLPSLSYSPPTPHSLSLLPIFLYLVSTPPQISINNVQYSHGLPTSPQHSETLLKMCQERRRERGGDEGRCGAAVRQFGLR